MGRTSTARKSDWKPSTLERCASSSESTASTAWQASALTPEERVASSVKRHGLNLHAT